MSSSKRPSVLPIPSFLMAIVFLFDYSSSTHAAFSLVSDKRDGGIQGPGGGGGGGRRLQQSFRETVEGTNATFDCSPSGSCVSCLYSEKNEEKYHCSETGYHIPFKCIEVQHGSNVAESTKSKKSRSLIGNSYGEKETNEIMQDADELSSSIISRRLLDDSSTSEGVKQAYITYRSCVPTLNEERFSVIGFEGIMFCLLLVSGSFTYIRRKRTAALSGAAPVRLQTNSRF